MDKTSVLKKATPAEMAEAARNIARNGNKLVIPETMSYSQVIDVMKMKMEEEESPCAFVEEFNAHPLDGAYALTQALYEIFGAYSPRESMSFFGPQPPRMISVPTSTTETVPVIWGELAAPGIEGTIKTGAQRKSSGEVVFVFVASTKKKYEAKLKELAKKTKEILAERSIYKGKAIVLRVDENGEMNQTDPPNFLDLSNASMASLTFSEDLMRQVEVNIFTLIKKTDAVRKSGIPLKRGILLEGPYGTGKTLTAFTTAELCEMHGWTFIYVDRVIGLHEAYRFAKRYAPAVIFVEDIDRVTEGGRSVKVDDILNNCDGIESKSLEVITIFTTNHVENIQKAMIRPGRIDVVLHIGAPDAVAAGRLIREYSKDILAPNEDISEAAELMAGNIPAMIREIVERAKLYCINRSTDTTEVLLTNRDLVEATKLMRGHMDLLKPATEAVISVEEQVGKQLFKLLDKSLKPTDEGLNKKLDEIKGRLG